MEGNEDDDDVVRFATTLFYATEEQKEVELAVLRSGEPSNACSVRCFTRDLSGQAGIRYGSVDETLEFAEGESLTWVRVPILQDNAWHTCEASKDLWRKTRVEAQDRRCKRISSQDHGSLEYPLESSPRR